MSYKLSLTLVAVLVCVYVEQGDGSVCLDVYADKTCTGSDVYYSCPIKTCTNIKQNFKVHCIDVPEKKTSGLCYNFYKEKDCKGKALKYTGTKIPATGLGKTYEGKILSYQCCKSTQNDPDKCSTST